MTKMVGWVRLMSLEVGSPGATKPLLLPRQYLKHIGRTFKITLIDDTEVEAELTSADVQGITVKYEAVRKEGKKKIKEILTPTYPFEQIKKAVIKLKF